MLLINIELLNSCGRKVLKLIILKSHGWNITDSKVRL